MHYRGSNVFSTQRLALVSAPLMLCLGAAAPQSLEECTGSDCLPVVTSVTIPGSGWSVTASPGNVGRAKPGANCPPCWPCKTGVVWLYDGNPWDKYRWVTGGEHGAGSYSGGALQRLATQCDSAPDYFIGEFTSWGTWEIGAYVILDCVCSH